MSTKLFDNSDDEDNDEVLLRMNKDYAKSYNNFRKKELLKKYKDRGLNVSDSDLDSSSDDSSEEEEEVIDPKFDQEFFKTLASLKSKDPTIYDKNTRFFDGLEDEDDADDDDNEEGEEGDKETEDKKKKARKSKPVTLKDYERKVVLEHNGKFEDDSDVELDDQHQERPDSPTAVEAERRLKDEFKEVMAGDDSGDEEFGGIFRKRTKTKAETAQEEEDFVNWLAGKQEDIDKEAQTKLEPLKNYWNNDNLPQSERFLRDYILNKGYAKTKLNEIPTYDEIVSDPLPLSEDEQELEKQDEFEHKYNFRFEEPDAEFIKRYPRTIENSLRRTDDKRKEKRKEQKDRKEQEKKEKIKEIEMLKEMKRKEIEEKIRKLKAVTGNDELGFKDEELEQDFDPEAHDRRMEELFNEEYYGVDEGEEKPECPSDIDELQIEDWDNYDPRQNSGAGDDDDDLEPHCEDDDFVMDCDYDPKKQLQEELIENSRKRKGRKGRRNRFLEIIKAEKPVFNPEDEQAYGDYIDEYYKLDCEDVIGDVPCRFKYVETTPNDFGLTIEEILLAKNKELNQWASLKKAVQWRPEHVEKKEQRLYKMKAKNEELKRKIFKSLYGEGSEDEEENEPSTEQPSTSKALQIQTQTQAAPVDSKDNQVVAETIAEDPTNASSNVPDSKSKRRRLRRKAASVAQKEPTATENTIDLGNPPAKKAKLDVIPEENGNTISKATEIRATPNGLGADKKKKKKKNKPKSKQPPLPSTTANGLQLRKDNNVSKSGNPFSGKPKEKPSTTATSTQNHNNVSKAENSNSAKSNPFNGNSKAKPSATATSTQNHKNVSKTENSNSAKSNPFNGKPKAKPSATATSTQNHKNVSKTENSNSAKSNPFNGKPKAKPNATQTTNNSNSNDITNPPTSNSKSSNPFNSPINNAKTPLDKNKPAARNWQSNNKHNNNNKFKFNGKKPNTKTKGKSSAENSNGISDDRLKAYGINPRKFHNKQKYGNKQKN